MRPAVAEGAHSAMTQLQQAIADSLPYSLVITDVNMPGMDGFGLAEEIRRGSARPTPRS